ncbi:MliC family protein [Roseibium sp.]|uniref:MliC family protein n=1 Tax=Roseibium sp. TaxID=1936156 RepID=UPI003D0B5B69
MTRILLALTAAIAAILLPQSSLFAQSDSQAVDGPAFDCSKAESQIETLICEDADLAALDRLINARFEEAVASIRKLDAGAEEAEKSLRAYQRGWIKGRNDCWKADTPKTCVELAYQRREGELVAQNMLEKPVGMARWQCGGNPANEVYTFFFDTELPSIRIEYGDTIDTGSLAPSGSGSRYEASFGRSFWSKGNEAVFDNGDGNEQSCEKVD